MEVPVINRVGDLHLIVGKIPTMISRVLIDQIPEILSFWKWGAVIIAAVYAIVNSLLVSFKIEFLRFRNRQSAVTKALLSYATDDDYTSDEDNDDDDSVSSSSLSEDEYSEDDEVEKVKLVNDGVFSSLFDFRVAGGSEFEREDVTCRFTWSKSNIAKGKSVVKLWDGIGLGLNASGSINNPSVVLFASDTRDPFVNLIDTRIGQKPVITWSSSNCGERVRVTDLRKAREEVVVEDAAEWSCVTWWDADGGDGDVAGL